MENKTVVIDGKNDSYEIGGIVAENERCRTRSCTNSNDRELLIQVAIDASQNTHLSRNGWVLTRLKDIADGIAERLPDSQFNLKHNMRQMAYGSYARCGMLDSIFYFRI